MRRLSAYLVLSCLCLPTNFNSALAAADENEVNSAQRVVVAAPDAQAASSGGSLKPTVAGKATEAETKATVAAMTVPKAAAEAAAKPVKPKAPSTTLVAKIDLSAQRMTVSYGGQVRHTWKISSGRKGHITPRGSFRPSWMSRMWYSRQYDGAPMPYAVFFNRGIATHGTNAVHRLGRPASHGCIRLRTSNARTFYNLVRKHGKSRTRIIVHGTTPLRAPRVARSKSRGTTTSTYRARARRAAAARRAQAARRAMAARRLRRQRRAYVQQRRRTRPAYTSRRMIYPGDAY